MSRVEGSRSSRRAWVAVAALVGASLIAVAATDQVAGGMASRVATALLGVGVVVAGWLGRHVAALEVTADHLTARSGDRRVATVPADEVLQVEHRGGSVAVLDLAGAPRLSVALPAARADELAAALRTGGYPLTSRAPAPTGGGDAGPTTAPQEEAPATSTVRDLGPDTVVVRRRRGLRAADAATVAIVVGLGVAAWATPFGAVGGVVIGLAALLVAVLMNADRWLDLRLEVGTDAAVVTDRRGRRTTVERGGVAHLYVGGPPGHAHLRVVDEQAHERFRLRLLGIDPDEAAAAFAGQAWPVVRLGAPT